MQCENWIKKENQSGGVLQKEIKYNKIDCFLKTKSYLKSDG